MSAARLFHALVFGAYAYALYYDVRPPPGSPFERIYYGGGGRLKFLTFSDMLLQSGYFLLALVNDFAGSSTMTPTDQTALQRARDWLFTALAFPLGSFVTFIFWTLYAFDRELILPSSMDPWFPPWLNHVMHTLPLLSVMVEQVMMYHTHQTGTSRLLPIFTVYVLYLTWLVVIRQTAGFWVYPVFDALDGGGRVVFLLLLSAPALFFYVLGERVHVAVWGYQPVEPSEDKPKRKPKRN